jgi:hypothetical protein
MSDELEGRERFESDGGGYTLALMEYGRLKDTGRSMYVLN